MLKEERMIKRLKSRRNRIIGIIACTFLVVLMSACLGYIIYQRKEFDSLITPEQVSTMASFENPKEELPELFCRFHELAERKAEIMDYMMYFSVFMGLFIAMIITLVADITNRHLLVSMWDRIEKLQQEIKELKQINLNGQ